MSLGSLTQRLPWSGSGEMRPLTSENIIKPVSPKTPAWHKSTTSDVQPVRRTKIVCAIGPASCSVRVLGELLDAGMNTARFNFSHATHEFHAESLKNLRTAVKQRQDRGEECQCAVLLDTKGPEIRTGLNEGHEDIQLERGQTLEIVSM